MVSTSVITSIIYCLYYYDAIMIVVIRIIRHYYCCNYHYFITILIATTTTISVVLKVPLCHREERRINRRNSLACYLDCVLIDLKGKKNTYIHTRTERENQYVYIRCKYVCLSIRRKEIFSYFDAILLGRTYE